VQVVRRIDPDSLARGKQHYECSAMKCQVIPAAVGENRAEIQIRYWWNWKTKTCQFSGGIFYAWE